MSFRSTTSLTTFVTRGYRLCNIPGIGYLLGTTSSKQNDGHNELIILYAPLAVSTCSESRGPASAHLSVDAWPMYELTRRSTSSREKDSLGAV